MRDWIAWYEGLSSGERREIRTPRVGRRAARDVRAVIGEDDSVRDVEDLDAVDELGRVIVAEREAPGRVERGAAAHQFARPVALELHQRAPRGIAALLGEMRLVHAERAHLVLRQVDTVVLRVIDVDVLPEVDELQARADGIRSRQAFGVAPAEKMQQEPPHGVGGTATVIEELREIRIALDRHILAEGVQEVATLAHLHDRGVHAERRRPDLDALHHRGGAGVREVHEHAHSAGRGQALAQQAEPPAARVIWGSACYLVPWQDGSVLVPAFTDLKRHDMGAELYTEALVQAGVPTEQYLTRKLWGMANEPPFLHNGRALTIHDAIVKHGGEAQAARDAYLALDATRQRSVVDFLKTLQVLPENSPIEVVE